jgi:hypothetical protein
MSNTTAGICWILSSFAIECVREGAHYSPDGAASLGNMLRTRRGNPDIPLCLLSSMRVGAIASTLRAGPASRWVAPELGDARAVERWLKLNVRIVTIPCALPDAWPLAASLAPRWEPELCDNCELAMRGLRERQPPLTGRLIQMTAGMRHSRFTKIRAAAHTPFDATLILDADAAVCAESEMPIQGVVDYLRLVNGNCYLMLLAITNLLLRLGGTILGS